MRALRRFRSICLLWLTAIAAITAAAQQPPPRFEDYKIAASYLGPVTPPKFGDLEQYSGTDLRCFGGEPAAYAAERVNFAGHYVN